MIALGYLMDGKTYRSLTAIAKRITGANWSGPRFFGLVDRSGKQQVIEGVKAEVDQAPDIALTAESKRLPDSMSSKCQSQFKIGQFPGSIVATLAAPWRVCLSYS